MNRTKELLIRTLSTLLFVPILIYSLFGSIPLLFPLIIMVVSIWGIIEYYELIKKSKLSPNCILGLLSLILLCYMAIFSNIQYEKVEIIVYGIVFFIGTVIYIFRTHKPTESFFGNVSATILGIIYLGGSLPLLILLQRLPSGSWYIIWLIMVTWFCDIGAYLVGSRVGKNKLCPSISPGKTVEGLIGGILFSLIAGTVIWYYFHVKYNYISYSFWTNLGLAFLITSIGVIGDLAESVLKRQAGVKDSGNTYTGHGGILDVVDSLLFTAPAFYYLHTILL